MADRLSIIPDEFVPCSQYLSNLLLTLNGFNLFQKDINDFFCEKYLYCRSYKTGELVKGSNPNKSTVSYISEGTIMLYGNNPNNVGMFSGFMPCYSTYANIANTCPFGKTLIATEYTRVYSVSLRDYALLLSKSDDIVAHQLAKHGYIRNFNDYPLSATMHKSARIKVYGWVLYEAVCFGKYSGTDAYKRVIVHFLSNDELARHLNMHASTFSKYLGELADKGLALHDHSNIVVNDIKRLDSAIAAIEG